jgi:GT2 family glycosyltransferase
VHTLLFGNYPIENIEILIVDGSSKDATAAKVGQLRVDHPNVRLLVNKKTIVPAAMNIGVAAATHELLMWCGAHAKYDKDYVLNSVITLLTEKKISSVGGVITPIAKTTTGKAIAIATSSKFGVGNAQYRHATRKQHVDTVFGGCFYKKNILKIGGFNERWIRNQDYEFNHRLRKQIGPIILNPTIRCQYYCRESILQLFKQYFSYGFWRLNTLKTHPNSFTYRQAAPVILCLGLIVSMICIVLGFATAWLIPLLYFTACIAVSVNLALQKRDPKLLPRLPLIFATLHISWGLGFIKNCLETVWRKLLRLEKIKRTQI